MKKFLALALSLIMIFSLAIPSLAADTSAEKPFENSSFFDYEDYSIHYRTFEPAGEPTNQILLIHGFCLSTVSFEALAKEYTDAGYKVVLADVPSFGYSSRETTKTNLVDREVLMYNLMNSLSDKTWIVGGHSMGGGIAINLAIDYPETVSGLVLICAQTSQEARFPMTTIMRSNLGTGIFEFILGIALRIPSVIDSLVSMSFSDSDYAKEYDDSRIADPLKIKGTGASVAVMTSHTRGTDFDKLAKLTIPTAIITSSNDKVAQASITKQILESKPEGAYTYEFSYGGHMIMEYDAAATAVHTLPTMAAASFEVVE